MDRTRPCSSDDDIDNGRPVYLCEKKRKMTDPSDNVNNNDQPAAHSTSSGLAMLSADGWLDVAPFLDFYNNAVLRFASGALNRLIHRKLSTLPLRVIASLVSGYADSEKVYWAHAGEADSQTCYADLMFGVHESPESMLREVLSSCKGFVVAHLELRDFSYNEQVMDVVAQCLPFVTVTELFVDGVASGHDQVHRLLQTARGLRLVAFKNDADHPNAADVLSVCATRKIPAVSLRFAADTTEAQIIDFAFDCSFGRVTRQFGIISLRRTISNNFFESIVERCRRNECMSLRFGLSGLLTDPSDAKYSRFIVERDDSSAMYKFDKDDKMGVPFTILVGKAERFYLGVFQGDAHELCSCLAAAHEIPPYKM